LLGYPRQAPRGAGVAVAGRGLSRPGPLVRPVVRVRREGRTIRREPRPGEERLHGRQTRRRAAARRRGERDGSRAGSRGAVRPRSPGGGGRGGPAVRPPGHAPPARRHGAGPWVGAVRPVLSGRAGPAGRYRWAAPTTAANVRAVGNRRAAAY